jgi:hypothetical protein
MQHLVCIEAVAARGVEGAMHAPGVDLPRADAGQEHMPVVPGAVPVEVEHNHARGLAGIGVVVEQELDMLRVAGVDAEVDAARLRPRAGRERLARSWFGSGATAHRRV